MSTAVILLSPSDDKMLGYIVYLRAVFKFHDPTDVKYNNIKSFDAS